MEALMLTTYIEAALRHAIVERLPDDGSYYAEIPGFPGVWATGQAAYECLQELREVLEDWIVLQLRKNAALPDVDGLALPTGPVPA